MLFQQSVIMEFMISVLTPSTDVAGDGSLSYHYLEKYRSI